MARIYKVKLNFPVLTKSKPSGYKIPQDNNITDSISNFTTFFLVETGHWTPQISSTPL